MFDQLKELVSDVTSQVLQKNVKAASDVEYPAYGVTGPHKDAKQAGGDRKLAQSAQMYHYQHQKQQMIALEKASSEMKDNVSDDESGEEDEEGDYTVYECPGLAPTGEMEVRNPLFTDTRTPHASDNGEEQRDSDP
ncbi:PREDICTED: neural proliferation differentiation and control protein 1-like [Priapulus caudatus]|uniref:Neural proliferation differentiation and control protein 1-like n=1 Tax=Priapulus caudatus TaxID=37621 RepID=A0ABM1EP46_PRICU|nr:PREDICTED: neural proliferation differentiation and control protein 1-like [Priapulus caudatus]